MLMLFDLSTVGVGVRVGVRVGVGVRVDPPTDPEPWTVALAAS